MTQGTHKQREEFVAAIQQHAGGDPNRRLWLAERLMRYGATYKLIQERSCNGYQDWQGNWDEAAAKDDQAKEKRIEMHIRAICADFQCEAVFGGDPRGATVKIKVPSGYTNDWGQQGICVPTS